MQVFRLGVDVQQPGHDLALGRVLLQEVLRAEAIMRIVIGIELAQRQPCAVVLLHHLHGAGRVVHADRVAADQHVEPVHRVIMLAHIIEALGRAGVVVEGDAGADHVDEGRALVTDGGRDQRHQLRLVAGEAARHEGRAELQRDRDEIDRIVGVGDALLRLGAEVGGGRELALGQAVYAVVLDDVGHVDAAADRMRELAEADRGGVAVAGDAEINQVAVGEIGAGQDRRHAAVHRVEAVRIAEEVIRRLRGAADAGNLRHPVRLDRQLVARLDDRRRDGVVAAAGAQRRDFSFVVAMGVAQLVLGKARMVEFRLGDVGHASVCRIGSSCCGTWQSYYPIRH
ncbi:hypothetical protein ES703_125579 [subsurface metagenome]